MKAQLAPGTTIDRLIVGGWQWARGHGAGPADEGELDRLVEAGAATFDCADIYTGVEELLGRLLRRSPRRGALRVHTKCVPDLDELPRLGRRGVERIVDRSLSRLGVPALDLVQLHWWDFGVPGHVEAAGHLDALRRAGKIRLLGVTNYDGEHLLELLRAGLPVVSNQVQYSLVDRRPEHSAHGAPSLVAVCREHGVALLGYGALLGGLVGKSEIEQPPGAAKNRSQVKYRLILDEAGGWSAFAELSRRLRRVVERHGVSPAAVAVRAVLDLPGVAAVIAGARTAALFSDLRQAFELRLDDEERALLAAWQRDHPGPAGAVYALERDRLGPHGRIMRYDLNRAGA